MAQSPVEVGKPQHPVITAAIEELRQAAASDLALPVNRLRLKKAQAALEMTQKLFASPADVVEEELALAENGDINAEYNSSGGLIQFPSIVHATSSPPSYAHTRRQPPYGPETFVSRIAKEAMALVPELVRQGAETIKLKRLHGCTEISYEIRMAVERGDRKTAVLLRKALKDALTTMAAPVSTPRVVAEGLSELPVQEPGTKHGISVLSQSFGFMNASAPEEVKALLHAATNDVLGTSES